MRKRTTTEWMAASLCVALAIVLIVRLGAPPGDKLGIALRATARWSFLWFWLASAGGALTTLFGPRFQVLARHGRDFGLAFASAHLAHLGLVAWLYRVALSPPPPSALLFFGIAALWTYVLAILSIKHLSAKLNPRVWRLIRTLGVEYIGLAFLADFGRSTFQGGALNLIIYLPFLALAIAGPLLRLAALAKRSSEVRRLTV